MTAPFDSDACEHEAAQLLPWFVTGRLATDEASQVAGHLAGCAACRADLVRQREIHALMHADDRIEYAPTASFQKLLSRIDEMDREMAPVMPEPPAILSPPPVTPESGAGVPRWVVAAMLVQTVALGVLGVKAWERGPARGDPARFVTLSAPENVGRAAPQVRLVFAPQATAGDIAQLLGAERAQIVGGPSESGAYTVALPGAGAAIEASLTRLRADARVVFAEPVVVAGTP